MLYIITPIAEGIDVLDDCPNPSPHHLFLCAFCNCSFPAHSLGQHRSEKKHLQNAAAKKHLQNVAANEPVTPYQPPLPPSNLPNSRPVSLPSTPSPAIGVPVVPIASDPRVTVTRERGLDFVVEGTEIAGRTSFPPVSLAILIQKTEIESGLSTIPVLRLVRTSDTPESWCGLFDDSI